MKMNLFEQRLSQRCHDDIGGELDYPWLREKFSIDEAAHKRYLNDWFTGKFPGSDARGELYNDDPRLGDARLCGTTVKASQLMKLMSLGVKQGNEITVAAEGPSEEEALAAMKKFFEENL